jgi:hypothetical protein
MKMSSPDTAVRSKIVKARVSGFGAACLLGASVLLAGCAADDQGASPVATHGPARSVDVSIFDVGRDLDTIQFARPEERLDSQVSPIAMAGSIDGIEDGPTVLESESGLGYPDIRERFALVRIRVEQTLRGGSDESDPTYVYVTLSRGAEVIDEDGNSVRSGNAPSTVADLDAFAVALPAETRVVVMGSPWSAARGPHVHVRNAKPLHSDAEIIDGADPQAFSVEVEPGGLMHGWHNYTFATLTKESAAALTSR